MREWPVRVDGRVRMVGEEDGMLTIYCHLEEGWFSMKVRGPCLADVIAVMGWGAVEAWASTHKFYLTT